MPRHIYIYSFFIRAVLTQMNAQEAELEFGYPGLSWNFVTEANLLNLH